MKDEPIQKFLTPSIKNESQESSSGNIITKPLGSEGWLLVDVDKIPTNLGCESDLFDYFEEESDEWSKSIIYQDRESEESVHLEFDESDSDSEDFKINEYAESDGDSKDFKSDKTIE